MKNILYIIGLLLTSMSFAQTEVHNVLDTNQALIGDVINYDLSVKTDQQIYWPNLEEYFAPIEIQSIGAIDTLTHKNDLITYSQKITLQHFDTGNYVLSNLPFITAKGDTFYSDSVALDFLAVPIDTAQAIYDIKKPKEVPFNFEEAKPYIYGFILFVLLIVLIYYLIQKLNTKTETKEIIEITIPCEVEAIEALKVLEAKALFNQGLVKEHYVELTEILRRYFDKEFAIDSLESTSDETIELLKSIKLDKELVSKISDLLIEADLVKFAKSSSDKNSNATYMKLSYSIIESCHQMKKEAADV